MAANSGQSIKATGNSTGDSEYDEWVNSTATTSKESMNTCLSGYKFDNSTGEGIPGWIIHAIDSKERVFNATTGDDGYWEICSLSEGIYTVCEEERPGWTNVTDRCLNANLANKSISNLNFYNFHDRPPCSLTLTKTVDKPTACKKEGLTYTIKLSNHCPDNGPCLTNVILWDVLPAEVELVSVSPLPTSYFGRTLTWDIGRMCARDEIIVTIVVRFPIIDINYDMEQGVSGIGFVNVYNDYDTHQGPEDIVNCASAKADFMETICNCATTSIVDPGTEIRRREFGSGTYESMELTRTRTENESIRSTTSLAALYQPTNFSIPQNRSITYSTLWNEKSMGINGITGTSLAEEYTFSSKIKKDRDMELTRSGSNLTTDVEFNGTGHIEILKRDSPGTHPRFEPSYEAVEDFVGSFRVKEVIAERFSDSLMIYDSNTGASQNEELMESLLKCRAKDINPVHEPTNCSSTPNASIGQGMEWPNGNLSKSGNLTDSVVMTNASMPGVSRVATSGCNGTQLENHLNISVHLDATLDMSANLNATDPTLIHYTIALQNKGNSTLAATLTDMLPAGLSYLSGSPEPARHEGQFLEWVVPDLQPEAVAVIEYQARAGMDGVYVNAVHLDASAVDGSGYDTADAAARVEVRSTGVSPRTVRYGGWQPPDWNMTSPDQGITVDLSPEEDMARVGRE